jgi:hypothetical protein
MRNIIRCSGVLIMAGFFATAHAAEGPRVADIHCLIVGSLLSNSTDAGQRASGSVLVVYSIGILDAFSSQEIEDAMVSEYTAMAQNGQLFKSETLRCGMKLQEKGLMMQKIGANLIRRGKEMNKHDQSSDTSPTTPPADSE